MIRQTKTTITGKKPKMGKSIIIDADDVKAKTASDNKKKTAKTSAEENTEKSTAEGGI